MQKTIFILIFLTGSFFSLAQPRFTTVVPHDALVQGESFQVQYILEGADKSAVVKTPLYPDFRLISGPNIYTGSISREKGTKPVLNAVVTLEAISKGHFIIPGAQAVVNGVSIRSEHETVEVISKTEAVAKQKNNPGSGFYLGPGENPQEKIRKDLFIRLQVNKKTCYVGEPVLATFKLYSRLESRSDIIKNPGFYGFAVVDMVSLEDKQVSTETIGAETFDAHTIRQVQLFPLQPGVYTIDPMDVQNKIFFSKLPAGKTTSQDIREGINGYDTATGGSNTLVYENEISTDPVQITVRPWPVKSVPAEFNGATGQFSIKAGAPKNELYKNEEGEWIITVSGSGNLTQLTAPAVNWPKGMEMFEPVIHDSINNKIFPVSGSRSFHFPFIISASGVYEIPAQVFVFFDPVSGSFKNAVMPAGHIKVSMEEKRKAPVPENKSDSSGKDDVSWKAAGIVILIVLASLGYWISRKKEPEEQPDLKNIQVIKPIDIFLQKAEEAGDVQDAGFYKAMQEAVIQYASQFLLLQPGEGKEGLVRRLAENNYPEEKIMVVKHFMESVEIALYTGVDGGKTKSGWMSDLGVLLENIGRHFGYG